MLNKYDLTITNCAITVENIFSKELKRPFDNSINLKEKIRQNILESLFGFSDYVIFDIHYYRELHGLILDIAKESNIQTHEFSIDYLLNLNFFSDEDLASIPEKPNDGNYNSLLKKYRFSFLHNNTVVSFENDFEITIEYNETLYYKFLILMLCDYGVLHLDEILDHHVQKLNNPEKFIQKLKKHLLVIPKILKDEDILNEIENWINNSNISTQPKNNTSLGSSLNVAKKSKLDYIFKSKNDYKYIDVFTKLNPPLLEIENERYRFVGNNDLERGVLGAWFCELREKKLIKHLSDDKLAQTLSSEIDNFTISRHSVKRQSGRYSHDFKDILEELLNQYS